MTPGLHPAVPVQNELQAMDPDPTALQSPCEEARHDARTSIGVLLSNGDGTFQTSKTYGSGGVLSWMTTSDVNGDGKPDLLVANRDGGINGQAQEECCSAREMERITATYGGDADFAGSTSPELRQVVKSIPKSATTTTLFSSLNPAIYGQKITLVAQTISAGANPPTGNVVFRASQNGANLTLGTVPLNAIGVASLTKSNLNGSYSYSITAVYSGDMFNLGSTSAVVPQVVKQARSAATITSSANPSSLGQAVTFTARITSPTVTVTGPVTFTAGNTVLGTAQLSSGKATFTTSALPTGSTTVNVTYPWNSNVAKSSASLLQTVR
jgi:Bacterial Ig-like domain (group 3)/FG-GAP repeat